MRLTPASLPARLEDGGWRIQDQGWARGLRCWAMKRKWWLSEMAWVWMDGWMYVFAEVKLFWPTQVASGPASVRYLLTGWRSPMRHVPFPAKVDCPSLWLVGCTNAAPRPEHDAPRSEVELRYQLIITHCSGRGTWKKSWSDCLAHLQLQTNPLYFVQLARVIGKDSLDSADNRRLRQWISSTGSFSLTRLFLPFFYPDPCLVNQHQPSPLWPGQCRLLTPLSVQSRWPAPIRRP